MTVQKSRIVVFGAYDVRKPRVRLLVDAIRRAGALQDDILVRAWEFVPQTSVPSRMSLAKVLFRMALRYPGALLRLIQSGRGGAVLLPYPGILEIILIAPIARLLGRRLILDAFLPIHDTIVGDRGLIGEGVVSRLIWWFEKAALSLADIIIVDTDSHGEYFSDEFGIDPGRFMTVLVGAEPLFTTDRKLLPVDDILENDERPIVLFYGQLIPLHGVPTIIRAAREYEGPDARWIIIGRGQLEPLVEQALADGGEALARQLTWIKWVDYEKLPSVIAKARICLGVFGASEKAARVIPNKLFQQAAMGKPVITRASPAVDLLARDFPEMVKTVPEDNPKALARAVAEMLSNIEVTPAFVSGLTPDAGVVTLLERLSAGD